jgi:hypothetical protein
MTDVELIEEIERRAKAAPMPQGPDYQAIVRAVAEENGVPYEHLRGVWVDDFLAGPC